MICYQKWYQSKSEYTDKACVTVYPSPWLYIAKQLFWQKHKSFMHLTWFCIWVWDIFWAAENLVSSYHASVVRGWGVHTLVLIMEFCQVCIYVGPDPEIRNNPLQTFWWNERSPFVLKTVSFKNEWRTALQRFLPVQKRWHFILNNLYSEVICLKWLKLQFVLSCLIAFLIKRTALFPQGNLLIKDYDFSWIRH